MQRVMLQQHNLLSAELWKLSACVVLGDYNSEMKHFTLNFRESVEDDLPASRDLTCKGLEMC